jgi:hypothetical protein
MEQPRLLVQVRNTIRLKHYSLRTEDRYLQWIKRYIIFHNKRYQRATGKKALMRCRWSGCYSTHLTKPCRS